MLKNRRSYKRISQVAVASLLTGLGVYAQAADLYLTGNAVNIVGSGDSAGFSQSAAVGSTGLLANVANVPLVANMGIPSFNFTLNAAGSPAVDGSYTFRVGVTIDDNATERRIEAKLETLQLTISGSGATLTGSIPAQTLRVLGRDGSGSVTVLADLSNAATNGPVAITGGTVSFDAEALIARIRASNPGLTTIVDEFGSASHYTYRIVVQQTSGAAIGFGTTGFVPFPKVRTTCSLNTNSQSSSVFVLNSNEVASSFTEAYAVQGQFSATGSASSFGTLTAFTDDCTPATTGGGTVTPPPVVVPPVTETTTNLNQQITDIVLPPPPTGGGTQVEVPAATQTLVNTAVDTSATLATNTANQIAAGTITTTVALSALDTSSNALATAGSANVIGATINMTSAISSVTNIASALSNLSTASVMTPAEITTATNIVTSTFESSVKLIDSTTTAVQIGALINANVALLESLVKETQTVSAALVTQAQTLATTALKAIVATLPPAISKGVDTSNPIALAAALSASPTMTQQAISNSLKVPEQAKFVASTTTLNLVGNSISNAQQAQRAQTAVSETLTARYRPEEASVQVLGSTVKVIDLMIRLLSRFGTSSSLVEGLNIAAATGDTITSDKESGTMSVKVGSANIIAIASAARLVPSSVATGVSSLPDGRTLLVESGVGVDLAPTSVNTIGFTTAVYNAGFSMNFRENGSVGITLSANETFSGAFAYDSVGTTTSATCGAMTFTAPTGSPAATTYAFMARCANGTTQRITPFAADTKFYTTLANSGLEVTTDRNTGTVRVGTAGSFKPGFFVKALTDADTTFLNANKNADGVAFRAKESNGDGKMDYEFITASGVQILYGM
ncbi:MAG: hypothetical protein Q7V56_11680 [Gammaproteobacteria bacterium]|nr:hypothetical protein [Gammaproteobacteria bacterium]